MNRNYCIWYATKPPCNEDLQNSYNINRWTDFHQFVFIYTWVMLLGKEAQFMNFKLKKKNI